MITEWGGGGYETAKHDNAMLDWSLCCEGELVIRPELSKGY